MDVIYTSLKSTFSADSTGLSSFV